MLGDTSTGVYIAYGLALFIWLIMLVVTVSVASRKGHSGILFGIFSFFCPIVALIVALAIAPKPGAPYA
ncbi:MAG: hypothetical protein ACRDV7_13035 [Acidimicrobiia bacterium]|jgi:hypothetical protein